MTDQIEKCKRLAALHAGPRAFVIPNPWDAGSARLLHGLGFTALATTSAGAAFAFGQSDGDITLAQKLAHCSAVVAASSLPVSADFENGFAEDPDTVAANVLALAKTGVAGCSIEDYSRDTHTLYSLERSVQRVAAAAAAVRTLGMPFQLTARAENLLRGVDDLDDTIERLQAYAAAGADVLYAPGIRRLDDLARVTAALDKPFNALAPFFRDASVDDLAAAGATRISLGSALTWAALKPVIAAAREMLEQGTFGWTRDIVAAGEVNDLLSRAQD